MAPAQSEPLRQASTARLGSAAPTEPPPAAAAVEAPQQHGSGCCWETWSGGKPAPEQCGAKTLPGRPGVGSMPIAGVPVSDSLAAATA